MPFPAIATILYATHSRKTVAGLLFAMTRVIPATKRQRATPIRRPRVRRYIPAANGVPQILLSDEVNDMKAKIIATLGALAIGSSAAAGNYGEWFEKVDANADGYLSAEELGEKKAHKIDKIDTDGDRLISREEFDAYKAAKHHKKGDTA